MKKKSKPIEPPGAELRKADLDSEGDQDSVIVRLSYSQVETLSGGGPEGLALGRGRLAASSVIACPGLCQGALDVVATRERLSRARIKYFGDSRHPVMER